MPRRILQLCSGLQHVKIVPRYSPLMIHSWGPACVKCSALRLINHSLTHSSWESNYTDPLEAITTPNTWRSFTNALLIGLHHNNATVPLLVCYTANTKFIRQVYSLHIKNTSIGTLILRANSKLTVHMQSSIVTLLRRWAIARNLWQFE